MGLLRFPSPDDPARAPVWENYIIAQTVTAALGQIPAHALAMGVEVDGTQVRMRFQLTELDETDSADIGDITSTLEDLVGGDVDVSVVHEIRAWRSISPDDGVCWVFYQRGEAHALLH